MKLSEIKEKAHELGVNITARKKKDWILAIQEAEGNTPCFGSNAGDCPYTDCCFWSDCIKEYKKPT